MATELKPLYHEKQRTQLCLLHALNHIFQRQEFTKAELDTICENLDESRWFNAHRSWIGLGNYDVNVLTAALKLRDIAVTWFDRRLSATRINQEAVVAYVFNIPSTSFIPFFRGRHWFTVLKRGAIFYNLDSKLPEPVQIDDFILFANKLLAEGNQLFLMTRMEDAEKAVQRDPPD